MKPPKSFWPFGIIATFIVFITGTVSLIVMASMQQTDLVNNNYYEQEIRFQSRIDATKRAQESGATVEYTESSRQIVITMPAEQAARKATGDIQLYRPSAAGLDKSFKLELGANGSQTLSVAALEKGPWAVRVSWKVGSEEYFLEHKFVVSGVTKTAAR